MQSSLLLQFSRDLPVLARQQGFNSSGLSELDADAVDNALSAEQHQSGIFALMEKVLEWVSLVLAPFQNRTVADSSRPQATLPGSLSSTYSSISPRYACNAISTREFFR